MDARLLPTPEEAAAFREHLGRQLEWARGQPADKWGRFCENVKAILDFAETADPKDWGQCEFIGEFHFKRLAFNYARGERKDELRKLL